jgi:hypothetical protein
MSKSKTLAWVFANVCTAYALVSTAYGSGSEPELRNGPIVSPSGIERLWVFLSGAGFVEAQRDDDSTSDYLGRLRRMGVTDVVYSINRWDRQGISLPDAYDAYRRDAAAYEHLERVFATAKRMGMDVHLMLFLPADADFVAAWSPVIQRLTHDFDLRSLLLDAEGGSRGRRWWIHQPARKRARAAEAIRDSILEGWNRPEMGLGVSSLATGRHIGELLALADYGLPQMYLSETWGRGPAQVQSNMEVSYRRYGVGGRLYALKPANHVVVGLTARREILKPQSPLARTCIGLESVLTFASEEDGSQPPVREIAVWASDKLLVEESSDLRRLFTEVGRAIYEHGSFGAFALSAVCSVN